MKVAKVLHGALVAGGALATGVLATVPDAAMSVWNSSPELFQHFIPEPYLPVVSGVLTLLVAVGKLVKLKKGKV